MLLPSLGCIRRFHLRARVEITMDQPSAPPADPDVPDSGIRLLESRSCSVLPHRVDDNRLRQWDHTQLACIGSHVHRRMQCMEMDSRLKAAQRRERVTPEEGNGHRGTPAAPDARKSATTRQ
jgi:hypothetical protein